MQFWHNHNFIAASEKQFSAQERILRFGDGFFESIIAINSHVLWFSEHYERLILSAKILKLELPKSFTPDFFAQILDELLQKNKLKNARFRAVFYRKGDGLYTPENSEAGIFITCSEYTPIQGLNVVEKAIFFTEKKASGILANVKSCNALLFVMAALYAKENNAQEAIILNTENNICETVSANIFMLYRHQIITPPLSTGCVAGVVRTKLLQELNVEERPVSIAEFLAADAVFLTNVSFGIRAVRTIDGKNYNLNSVKPIYELYQKMLERQLA